MRPEQGNRPEFPDGWATAREDQERRADAPAPTVGAWFGAYLRRRRRLLERRYGVRLRPREGLTRN